MANGTGAPKSAIQDAPSTSTAASSGTPNSTATIKEAPTRPNPLPAATTPLDHLYAVS